VLPFYNDVLFSFYEYIVITIGLLIAITTCSLIEIARILIRMICHTDDYDSWISYIEDRPFNDQRYYISNAKLRALGWEVKIDLETGLKQLTSK
jgi:dTDP-D-glucose 4,6-dehydratase